MSGDCWSINRLNGKFVAVENKKPELKIKSVRRKKSDVDKGVHTLEYCGVIRLKETPLAIQKDYGMNGHKLLLDFNIYQ